MIEGGQFAPEFEALNQDGKTVRLSDFRGKNVILFSFPSAHDMSMGCTAQACGFRDEFPRIEAGNAVVLGICPDGVERLKKWHTGRKLQYDLLSDPDHAMLDAYGAWGTPILGAINLPRVNRSYWVIDSDGIVRDMHIGITPGESVKKALASLAQITKTEAVTP